MTKIDSKKAHNNKGDISMLMLIYNNILRIILLICLIIVVAFYNYLFFFYLKHRKKIIEQSINDKRIKKEKIISTSLSTLTHELKNPIAVCNGYLEMLNLDDKEKSKKYVSIIKSEMNRSLTVINDFSSYGKLKKLELEEIDLICLLDDTYQTLSTLFKENEATLLLQATEEELYISADYNKLKQVLINLLKNTLEAKKEDHPLQVKILVKNLKYKVKIIIKDNGIGMDKNTLDHIYDLFYTTKTNGTGIGTAFSKEVINLHKGTIKYNSVLDKGTEVIINLPKEKKS